MIIESKKAVAMYIQSFLNIIVLEIIRCMFRTIHYVCLRIRISIYIYIYFYMLVHIVLTCAFEVLSIITLKYFNHEFSFSKSSCHR